MEKLRAWLASRSATLQLLPGVPDQVVFEGKVATVFVNSRAKKREQLHAALHECGHVHVWRRRARNPRRRVAGCSLEEFIGATGRQKARTTRTSLATLEEEIEAWNQGELLAKQLRLRLRPEGYEKSRARALMTYVRWAARGTRKRKA